MPKDTKDEQDFSLIPHFLKPQKSDMHMPLMAIS